MLSSAQLTGGYVLTGKEDSTASKGIISVTMSHDLKDRIDDLVRDGVARSRAQLIEDAVKWYLDFTVFKWTSRGIYLNDVRVLLESENISSIFFSRLTPSDQYEIGTTAGAQSPVADILRLYYDSSPKDKKSRKLVFQLLQDYGWGSFRVQDNLVVISGPFYPAHFLRGYFESLLGGAVEIVETNVKENVALRIKS
jgi:Arc/MetJ-type ribon-helix-helix transcriptional regulator